MWNRQPAYAGQFYPADKEDLVKEMDWYMQNAKIPDMDNEEPIALIAPHAAYYYSGPIAAYSYKLLAQMKPEVVIVLAPAHRASYLGASYIDEGTYETPLGSVPIDKPITEAIMRRPNFFFIKEVHETEHSLEVQVPFIQQALGNSFTLVPIIIGTTEETIIKKLAKSLAEIISADKRKVAIVVSTDLSHYHPYDKAKAVDRVFMETLLTLDEDALRQKVETRQAEACGIAPLLTAVAACKDMGASKVRLLQYATSGDTSGEKDRVVGYLAAAIVKEQ